MSAHFTLFRDKVLEIGAEFYEIDVTFDLEEFHAAMDTIIPKRDPLAMMRLIVEEAIVRRGEKSVSGLLSCDERGRFSNLPFSRHPSTRGSHRNGVPWFTVTYCPAIIKCLDFAPYPFPNWGRAFNAIVWKVAQLRLGSSIDVLFNQFIVSVGGKPRLR